MQPANRSAQQIRRLRPTRSPDRLQVRSVQQCPTDTTANRPEDTQPEIRATLGNANMTDQPNRIQLPKSIGYVAICLILITCAVGIFYPGVLWALIPLSPLTWLPEVVEWITTRLKNKEDEA